jgi:putative cardiolipin synthase
MMKITLLKSALCRLILLLFIAWTVPYSLYAQNASEKEQSLQSALDFLRAPAGKSGAYIFDKGEKALLARAWLTDHAEKTIDIQYFIWSNDNIGTLAAESLLRAADRGVKIRVLVDDLLIDAPDQVITALNSHPDITIKIYNPLHTVGVPTWKRIINLIVHFRASNQRMHDKTFTVDGKVAIIGGRNMADEYFDYDHHYNFRDRDILLLGPVVHDIRHNFQIFWNSSFAVPVERLLVAGKEKNTESRQKIFKDLHNYAKNPENFEPDVRNAITGLGGLLPNLKKKITWTDIIFSHDIPGKNQNGSLSGGGATTQALVAALSKAKKSITIQSPYLVMPKNGIAFFKSLVEKNIRVRISTNSLASTDNLQAFSGYLKQRRKILAAGIEVYEFKPAPAIQENLIERYKRLEKESPVFAIHAKSLVIDHKTLFVGTFNLDPRSANLNTEVGCFISNETLAAQVEQAIFLDMLPENSWNAAKDNPDSHAAYSKRLKTFFWQLLPLNALL